MSEKSVFFFFFLGNNHKPKKYILKVSLSFTSPNVFYTRTKSCCLKDKQHDVDDMYEVRCLVGFIVFYFIRNKQHGIACCMMVTSGFYSICLDLSLV